MFGWIVRSLVGRWGGLLALVGAGAEPVFAQAIQGVFIGIDAYEGAALPNCVNDAKDVAALVAKNAPGASLIVLLDQQATRDSVLSAFANLARSSTPDTETHVYFSGHGGRVDDENGDERAEGDPNDLFDETWVMSDLDQLTDDEIGAALGKIKGRVIMLSDSCHSGTVTKDLTLHAEKVPGATVEGTNVRFSRVKYMHPATLEAGRKKLGKGSSGPRSRDIVLGPARAQQNAGAGSIDAGSGMVQGADNVWLFSACSADESANPTAQRNSAFTMFFLQGVISAGDECQTFGWMRNYIANQIRNLALPTPQTPALFGVEPYEPLPAAYRGRRAATGNAGDDVASGTRSGVFADPTEAARAQLGAVLVGLVDREQAGGGGAPWISSFTTEEGGTQFRIGDTVALKVTLASDVPPTAHLSIFSIGPTGDGTMIFPNFHEQETQISRLLGGSTAGGAVVIGNHPKYGLHFTGDSGQEIVVAFVTDWNPTDGIDWNRIGQTNQVFLVAGEHRKSLTQAGIELLRAPREKTLSLGTPRPRENHARATLILHSR